MWITEANAAAHIGRSVRTVQKWRQQGHLTHTRQPGIGFLVRAEDAEACRDLMDQRHRDNSGRPQKALQ